MNKETNVGKGAFLVSRSIFESEIWFKPPEYIKTWLYLFGKANHKEKRINGFVCKRGQYFCNYKELLEQLRYSVGYRKKRYNESFMKNVMKYLRYSLMIDTVKKPRGILVTICNYEYYQDLLNYEKTNEETNEKTRSKPGLNQDTLSINKNDKNDKKKPKTICDKKASPLMIELFERFWKEYPKRNGKRLHKDKALAEFCKIDDLNSVLIAVMNYSISTDVKNNIGIKDAFRWLRDKCWLEWLEPEEKVEAPKPKTTYEKKIEAMDRVLDSEVEDEF